jgi:tetratricopeptide (TPR) repeat protein
MTDEQHSTAGRSQPPRRRGAQKRSGQRKRDGDQRNAQRRGADPQAARGERGFGPYRKAERDPRHRLRDDAPNRGGQDDDRPARPRLRIVGARSTAGGDGRAVAKPARTRAGQPKTEPRRRRRSTPADVEQEIQRLAGRGADRALQRLMDAADAYRHDREREALRILRPLRDQLPDSPSVRELAGLCQYRLGNYRAAQKELEAFAELSNSVDQNPVLMDCYRAQRRWRKVESTWQELAAASPAPDLVAEGRIVYAGALADQGRLDDALAMLRKRAEPVRDPREHHLRLWYALADLEERAGNLARARDLFDRVRRADPQYVDVAERRAALG